MNIRDKGARGEREIITIVQSVVDKVYSFYSLTPPIIERNLDQVRNGGKDLIGIKGISIEVKRQETLNVEAWWKQCEKQAANNEIPILFFRENNKKWRVMIKLVIHNKLPRIRVEITLEDFIRWFEQWLHEQI